MISWTTRNGEVENKLEKDWDKLDLWVLGYGEGEDGKLVENFLPDSPKFYLSNLGR